MSHLHHRLPGSNSRPCGISYANPSDSNPALACHTNPNIHPRPNIDLNTGTHVFQ